MPDVEIEEMRIAPYGSTQFVLYTEPKAICSALLQTALDDEREETGEPPSLFADDDGYVRFEAGLLNEDSGPVQLTLTWETSEGEKRERRITLSSGDLDTTRSPISEKEGPPVRPYAVREPLSPKEVDGLSEEELSQRGLPLRPDPENAPRAYAMWKRVVQSEGVTITPRSVARPTGVRPRSVTVDPGLDALLSSTTSNNWSGFVQQPIVAPPFPPSTYDLVQGVWRVPRVDVAPGAWVEKRYPGKLGKFPGHTDFSQDCASSMWVGIDGFGVQDLVQAGTASDFAADFTVWEDGSEPTPIATLAQYSVWTEFLPQQPVSQVVANFPVNPGEELFVQVWMGDPEITPSGSGFFGNFFFRNLDTGLETLVRTRRGGTMVGGGQAVWIVERPSFGGTFKSLSNYGSAQMDNAVARLGGIMLPFSGEPSLPGVPDRELVTQVGLVEPSRGTLSSVAARTADSMLFTWQGP